MRKQIIILTLIVSFLFSFSFVFANENEWLEGGSLHRATMRDWSEASYENKLATAGDFVRNAKLVRNMIKKTGDVDVAYPYAVDLVKGIDQRIGRKGWEVPTVAEVASAVMVESGWYK
jgi:hypothetical protein